MNCRGKEEVSSAYKNDIEFSSDISVEVGDSCTNEGPSIDNEIILGRESREVFKENFRCFCKCRGNLCSVWSPEIASVLERADRERFRRVLFNNEIANKVPANILEPGFINNEEVQLNNKLAKESLSINAINNIPFKEKYKKDVAYLKAAIRDTKIFSDSLILEDTKRNALNDNKNDNKCRENSFFDSLIEEDTKRITLNDKINVNKNQEDLFATSLIESDIKKSNFSEKSNVNKINKDLFATGFSKDDMKINSPKNNTKAVWYKEGIFSDSQIDMKRNLSKIHAFDDSFDDSFIDFEKGKFEKVSKRESILGLRPFNSHWTVRNEKNNRVFSVPETKKELNTFQKKHLIDFWHTFDTGVNHRLPTIGSGRADSIMRLSTGTVATMLSGRYKIEYQIIDCRLNYEFYGGHIKGAVNLNSSEEIDAFFEAEKTCVLIFHCEYSSIRAPRLARYLRNKDRNENIYPCLKFPEIYILDGGYKKFYEVYSELCDPMHYVTMDEVNENQGAKKARIQ